MTTVEPPKRVENLILLQEAITRREDVDLVFRMRYDPASRAVGASLDDDFANSCFGNLILAEYHWNILNICIEFFDLEFTISYDDFCATINDYVEKWLSKHNSHELVVQISSKGEAKITALETAPRTDFFSGIENNDALSGRPVTADTYQVFLDNEITLISPLTTFPVYDSPPLSRAQYRRRSLIELHGEDALQYRSDVLMVSSNLEVMCGTETCVAFFRDGKWVTPSIGSGGRLDPMLLKLLRSGFLVEGIIKIKDVEQFEEVLLFSAVLGISRGVVMNPPPKYPKLRITNRDRPIEKMRASVKAQARHVKKSKAEQAEKTSYEIAQAKPPKPKSKRQRKPTPGTGVFRI